MYRPRTTYRITGAALVFVFILLSGIGCQRAESPVRSDILFATTPVFSFIVQEIAGDAFDVRSLLPAGQSPHTFEPRPSVVRAASNARILIYGAPNLDEWITRFEDLPQVSLIGLLPDSLWLPRGSATPNPHFWMDPLAVQAIARPLSETLCALEPDHCEAFRDNASAFHADLDSLNATLARDLSALRGASFVVSHPFLEYFATRYALETTSIVTGSGGLEPTPRALSRILESVSSTGALAVLTETSEPSRAARTVAESAGIGLIGLDVVGGTDGRMTYDDLLRYNAARLLEVIR